MALEVQKEVNPISDLRGTAGYRHEMAYTLTKRALKNCLNELDGGNNDREEVDKNSIK